MKGFVTNIEEKTLANETFRTVLYTAPHCQLVVMHLEPQQDIGEETHDLDQFLRVERGHGIAVLDGVQHELSDGSVVVVPAGTRHNLINTSTTAPLKLYTLYAPPNHRDGTVHATKADAQAHEEHFDGTLSE